MEGAVGRAGEVEAEVPPLALRAAVQAPEQTGQALEPQTHFLLAVVLGSWPGRGRLPGCSR